MSETIKVATWNVGQDLKNNEINEDSYKYIKEQKEEDRKKILIAGFEGDDNSAQILLDDIRKICTKDSLYLKNDFEISSKQIEEKLLNNYDYILIFGQKPDTKMLYLENNAILGEKRLVTDYNYDILKEYLKNYKYEVESSYNAGNYLCNNVFFRALDFKLKNNIKSKIAFIHIPTIDNIGNITNLSNAIKEYIDFLSLNRIIKNNN